MIGVQRYNIALLLDDNNLNKKIIDISRRYFLDIQDKYILGADGLPHVTLCQFKAANVDGAVKVYDAFKAGGVEDVVDLTIEKFNLRPGTLVNSGKFIAEYKVKHSPDLVDLQLKCANTLDQFGFKSLTSVKMYNPHITLSRISVVPKEEPSSEDLLCPVDVTAHLSLGLSTDEGVFIEEL